MLPDLHAAHEAFLCGDGVPAGVRDVVADSWERSMAAGFDPEHDRAPVLLVDEELAWTDAAFGRDDLEAWEVLARVAPYGAARSLAKARVAELATDLQPRRS
jgi:putative intracellular protease/amidase